jgi:hypothetical protein
VPPLAFSARAGSGVYASFRGDAAQLLINLLLSHRGANVKRVFHISTQSKLTIPISAQFTNRLERNRFKKLFQLALTVNKNNQLNSFSIAK